MYSSFLHCATIAGCLSVSGFISITLRAASYSGSLGRIRRPLKVLRSLLIASLSTAGFNPGKIRFLQKASMPAVIADCCTNSLRVLVPRGCGIPITSPNRRKERRRAQSLQHRLIAQAPASRTRRIIRTTSFLGNIASTPDKPCLRLRRVASARNLAKTVLLIRRGL